MWIDLSGKWVCVIATSSDEVWIQQVLFQMWSRVNLSLSGNVFVVCIVPDSVWYCLVVCKSVCVCVSVSGVGLWCRERIKQMSQNESWRRSFIFDAVTVPKVFVGLNIDTWRKKTQYISSQCPVCHIVTNPNVNI